MDIAIIFINVVIKGAISQSLKRAKKRKLENWTDRSLGHKCLEDMNMEVE